MRTNEIKNDLGKIKKWEEQIRPKDLLYKINQNKYDFQQYETIRSFGNSIYNVKININEADIDQSSLLDSSKDFYDRSRPNTVESKNKKKKYLQKCLCSLPMSRINS